MSIVEDVIDLAQEKMKLWHDENNVPYASYLTDSGTSTDCRLSSGEITTWMRREAYALWKKTPSKAQLQQVLEVLQARACTGPAHQTAIRVGLHNGIIIYLDLNNGSADPYVQITESGWRLVKTTPIKFLKTPGMLALPNPSRNGDYSSIWDLMNLTEDDKKLCIAWQIASLVPTGPHPVLVLTGEQGSTKTTTAKALGRMTDPSSQGIRSFPGSEREFAIAAKNSWVLPFDNISLLNDRQQDMLCRASTGAGFATRQLYTDDQELLIAIQRPIILTAIDVKRRSDLMDREINIELAPIPADKRITEAQFWKVFEECWAANLGRLLTALSASLKPVIDPPKQLPRMADFALRMVACESSLGWSPGTFLSLYDENRAASSESVLSDSFLAQTVQTIFGQTKWEGTSSELLRLLRDRVSDKVKDLPGDPRLLSIELRELAPALRKNGMKIEFVKKGKLRLIQISESD